MLHRKLLATGRNREMLWYRFSKLVQYVTTFIMHVLSVALTYNLFFSSPLNEDLTHAALTFYHHNSAYRYWFVFSSLISMLLLGVSVAYYTFSYGVIFYQHHCCNDHSLVELLMAADIYRLTLVDFGFISTSIAWNIIWTVHLFIQLGQSAWIYNNEAYMERANLLLLLSTQITLIALRYPALFQVLHYEKITTKQNQPQKQNVIQETAQKLISSI